MASLRCSAFGGHCLYNSAPRLLLQPQGYTLMVFCDSLTDQQCNWRSRAAPAQPLPHHVPPPASPCRTATHLGLCWACSCSHTHSVTAVELLQLEMNKGLLWVSSVICVVTAELGWSALSKTPLTSWKQLNALHQFCKRYVVNKIQSGWEHTRVKKKPAAFHLLETKGHQINTGPNAAAATAPHTHMLPHSPSPALPCSHFSVSKTQAPQ